MNAQEILENNSTCHNSSQETTISDTITDFIKNELNGVNDQAECYDFIYQKNSSALTVVNNSLPYESSDMNVYTPLKTVDYNHIQNHSRRCSTSLRHVLQNHDDDADDGKNGDFQSLRKLGNHKRKRTHGDIKIPKPCSTPINSLNGSIILGPDISFNINDTMDNDIFMVNLKSLSPEKQNEHLNIEEKDPLEITPVKQITQRYNRSSEDDIFASPQSTRKISLDSDSEYERMCNAILTNNFNPEKLSFEAIELFDDFKDISKLSIDKTLENVVESAYRDIEGDNNVEDQLNLTQSQNGNSEERETDRRRSVRLKEKRLVRNKLETNQTDGTKLKKKSIKNKKIRTNQIYSSTDDSDTDLELDRRKIVKETRREAEFPPQTLKKLKKLEIKLEHKVLPQHQLETNIALPPTLKMKKIFMKYSPLKKGKYSQQEDEVIKSNWKRFCEIHEWDPKDVKPFLQVKCNDHAIIRKLENRIKFIQFLARGLSSRSLYSVYRRFKNLFMGVKSHIRYTPSEDKKILAYLDYGLKNSKKCRKLAQLLGRKQSSIWQRYYTLKSKENHDCNLNKDVTWDIPLIEKFIKKLMDVTLSEDIRDLKDATIPGVVWAKLAKKLKIPQNTMRTFWLSQLHMQLFCPRPIYQSDIEIMLIEYMYAKGIASHQEISWRKISRYFDGMTTHYLSRLFYRMIYFAPASIKVNYAGTINWLYTVKMRRILNKPKDRYLPRLAYKDGKIEVIDDHKSGESNEDIDQ